MSSSVQPDNSDQTDKTDLTDLTRFPSTSERDRSDRGQSNGQTDGGDISTSPPTQDSRSTEKFSHWWNSLLKRRRPKVQTVTAAVGETPLSKHDGNKPNEAIIGVAVQKVRKDLVQALKNYGELPDDFKKDLNQLAADLEILFKQPSGEGWSKMQASYQKLANGLEDNWILNGLLYSTCRSAHVQ